MTGIAGVIRGVLLAACAAMVAAWSIAACEAPTGGDTGEADASAAQAKTEYTIRLEGAEPARVYSALVYGRDGELASPERTATADQSGTAAFTLNLVPGIYKLTLNAEENADSPAKSAEITASFSAKRTEKTLNWAELAGAPDPDGDEDEPGSGEEEPGGDEEEPGEGEEVPEPGEEEPEPGEEVPEPGEEEPAPGEGEEDEDTPTEPPPDGGDDGDDEGEETPTEPPPDDGDEEDEEGGDTPIDPPAPGEDEEDGEALVYDTFSGLVAGIAADAGKPSASYKLNGGEALYADPLSLKTATGPASLTIDGGDCRISAFGNRILFTVGAGVTLTLKNITFNAVPFIVDADGVLVLESGTEIIGALGKTAVAVRPGGTLDVRDGATVIDTPDIGFN
jgi:hypothetical protein